MLKAKDIKKAVGLKKLHLTKMEQFVKVEKKECAEKDQSEPQNIVTETLTVSIFQLRHHIRVVWRSQ